MIFFILTALLNFRFFWAFVRFIVSSHRERSIQLDLRPARKKISAPIWNHLAYQVKVVP